MAAQLMVNGQAGEWAPAVAGHLRQIHGVLGSLRLPPERHDVLRSALRAVPSSARVTTCTTTVLRYRDEADGLLLRTAGGLF
ncbi:hypothetical protein IPZ58_30695 [Streptomyces roseoverticillatus]|uniref:hypothetical protein n=1 Tax=Streptomyces roseoverticillatus TaxID=66429 RepID=UPI001F18A263|nr:hypothetical protein [Streptomyces roseoverticillatus]MCF3105918.1 hypothetical protein [Streptomyces roseoverticillatus]